MILFRYKRLNCAREIIGPKAASVLARISNQNLSDLAFMSARVLDIQGMEVNVSRCGYTGEDGFEISVRHEDAARLSTIILQEPEVELAGLGARDSLRLEAGLCLYGHDLNESISPVEGSLTWTIGARRRTEGGFLGADKIIPQIKGGVEKRRVGFIVEGAPAREGAQILNTDGQQIGVITSGCPSPILKQNVAMGYIKSGHHKIGTEVLVKVRNKAQKARVTKMPFVPQNYYRGA